MENKHISKSKIRILIFLLLSVFLMAGTGCKIFSGHNRSNGELITTKPHGRLAPGEIDDMSGSKNENQDEPEQGRNRRR
jgi:hypothetical protein